MNNILRHNKYPFTKYKQLMSGLDVDI